MTKTTYGNARGSAHLVLISLVGITIVATLTFMFLQQVGTKSHSKTEPAKITSEDPSSTENTVKQTEDPSSQLFENTYFSVYYLKSWVKASYSTDTSVTFTSPDYVKPDKDGNGSIGSSITISVNTEEPGRDLPSTSQLQTSSSTSINSDIEETSFKNYPAIFYRNTSKPSPSWTISANYQYLVVKSATYLYTIKYFWMNNNDSEAIFQKMLDSFAFK